LKHSPIGAFLGSAVLVPLLALAPACGRGNRGAAAPPATGDVTSGVPRAQAVGQEAASRRVVGIKIYEASPPFDGLFSKWRELGINTLFVSEALLMNADFRTRARANGLTLFLIYPVFQSPEAVKENPEIAAVTASGAPARDEWVEFVCPVKGDDYLERRIGHLKSLVAEGRPDVVSLDFIRYFVFWEKVAPDRTPGSLPQTCFCPSCLHVFQNEADVHVPAELSGTADKAQWILANHAAAWAEWKCERIARTVKRLTAAAREADPRVKVNLHLVPWRKNDFGGAVRSVAGQDLTLLAPLADYLSPMVYHHMVRQTPAWVHDVVTDISAQTRGAAILPSIQVAETYVKEPLAAAEFGAALEQALAPPSIGVVLWSWDALAKSPEKQALLRRLVH
jgi:hypothetical protein